MKRDRYLRVAMEIVSMILENTHNMMRVPIGVSGLGTYLCITQRFSPQTPEEKRAPYEPEILEIFLFGSLTNVTEENPGDIDICLVDNGYFSWFFNEEGNPKKDAYLQLSGNLERLFRLWFGINDLSTITEGIPVDLHILPEQFFKDPELRAEIAKRHKDPLFFQNMFKNIIRLYPEKKQNPDLGLAYFEKKYGPLDDLK